MRREDRGIVGGGEGVTGDRRSAEGDSKYGGSEPEWGCGEEDRGIVGGGEGKTGDRSSAEGDSKYGGSEPVGSAEEGSCI